MPQSQKCSCPAHRAPVENEPAAVGFVVRSAIHYTGSSKFLIACIYDVQQPVNRVFYSINGRHKNIHLDFVV